MIDYKSLSLANQVYQQIEKNILSGVYKAGEIISESKLSEELGVSRTPIREAIARLENDKLIGITPSGTVVLGITDEDVADMFAVKRALEPMVVKMAAMNISDEDLAKLKEILDQQEFYQEKKNIEKVRNLDTQFHDIIYSASGSPIFQAVLSPIHHKLMKYRKDSLTNEGRSRYSIEEHVKIYEAIQAGNQEKIEELVLKHVDQAYKSIQKGTSKLWV